MSIILACAFPEAAIILCDSRVSAKNSSLRSDTLRKIYQLGPFLVIGFASNDVLLSEKIISVMTDYVNVHTKNKNTRYLLSRLPKVAMHYYKKFTQNHKNKPHMEFIFAGLDKTVGAVISGKKLFELLKRSLVNRGTSGSISNRLIWGLERQKGDAISLPPPASIVAKLIFPKGEYEDASGLGYAVTGSDTEAAEKLQKAFEQAIIIGSDNEAIRQAMLASIIEDHRKSQKVDSIGGLTQTLLINEKGVSVLGYSYTEINSDGSKGDGISMSFENGNWIQKRTRDGKEIKVSKLSSKVKWNEKFEDKLSSLLD